MEDFELDLQFMSGLSQIAKTKEDFLDDAKKIIDGNENLTLQKKKLLALGQTENTLLELSSLEKDLSKKCFEATDAGNLDAHTVLGIINSPDIGLREFLQGLRVEAFQSDHFLSNMADRFYDVLATNLSKTLYDFLQTAIIDERTSSKTPDYISFIDLDSNQSLKNLLQSVTLGQLMMADLVHGRMISPFEKRRRKCATKTSEYSGKELYTQLNYNEILKQSTLKYPSETLLKIDKKELPELQKKLYPESTDDQPDYTHFDEKAKNEYTKYVRKAEEAKNKGKENFFKWVSLLKQYSENYNKIFTILEKREVFGKLSTQVREQSGGADINPEIAVAVAVNLVNSSNPESSKKASNTELTNLTVLFRKYTVIVYDRLIELTLGKYFNDLMETQVGYIDFRVKNFKKIFDSINYTDSSNNPSIFLLQEFDESYKDSVDRTDGIFEDSKLKSGSSSAIYCNGTNVEIKVKDSDVVAASVEKNGNKILFVSFHADSNGDNTLYIIATAYDIFTEGDYDYLVIGADTNAKNDTQRKELYNLVSSKNGKLFSIAYENTFLPTSTGMRSLLQSQFSKALDSIEETIDYLMIFGKGENSLNELTVELNNEFYNTSREGLSVGNPADHIPLFFNVKFRNGQPALKILTYNMAGPNTNVVEYMKYKSDRSYTGGKAHISEYEKLSAKEFAPEPTPEPTPESTGNEEIKKIAVSVVVADESQ